MKKELESLQKYIAVTTEALKEEQAKAEQDEAIIDSIYRQLDAMNNYKTELEYRISRS
jgi:hypothetical protein